MPRLGAHVSVAGGLERAFPRAEELGCRSAQIFVKSPNRWQGRSLEEDEVARFSAARSLWGPGPVIAHAAYLINLAAGNPEVLERSRAALRDEIDRSRRLGLDALVVHPGAHVGTGEEAGLDTIVESLDRVLDAVDTGGCRLLLESTAGQGTVLGHRLEQLEEILERCRTNEALGVCLDTCHLFAAGYPVHEAEGVRELLHEVLARFGPGRLRCIHVNDSRHGLGSRKDRHANLGEGEIDEEGFRALLRDPRIQSVPLVLETPLGEDREGHRRDLRRLRAWLAE